MYLLLSSFILKSIFSVCELSINWFEGVYTLKNNTKFCSFRNFHYQKIKDKNFG